MASNQVELGILISLDGANSAATGISTVTASTNGLGSALDNTGAQAAQAFQTLNTSAAQANAVIRSSSAAAAESIRTTTSAAQEAITAARAQAQAQREVAQVQNNRDAFVAGLRREAEALGMTRTQMLQLRAAELGATEQAAPFIARLNQTGMSAAATAAAMRSVPAQITDIVTSLQGGMPPLTVAIQQGGQLRDMFGGVGAAARAVGGHLLGLINPYTVVAAAVASLALAYYQGSTEADAYRQAIVMSGNVAGTTTAQMTAMAQSIAAATGATKGAAAESLAALVATGQAGVESMERLSAATVRAQESLGLAVKETVADFAELGKSPLQASEKLNEKYHYLTLAVYEQIKALELQGRTDEAAKVAQEAYAGMLESRSETIKANLGTLEKSWKSVTSAAKWAWDAMLDIGREDTFDEKLAKAEAALAKAKKARLTFVGAGADGKKDLDNAQAAVDALNKQKKAEEDTAKAQAESNRLTEAGIALSKEWDKYLPRQTQLKRELAAAETLVRNAAKPDQSAAETEKQITELQLQVRKKYSDIFNAGIDSQIEAVKRRGAIEDEVAERSRAALEANKAANLVTEADYLRAVEALDEAAFQRQKARLQEELRLVKGKANTEKDQAGLNGQIALINAQLASRQIKLQQDLEQLTVKSTRAIKEQAQAWTNSSAAEAQALTDETALFGRSAEARRIAGEQLKIDAELRQLVINFTKQGHTFSAQEIADLNAQAQARKDSIASIMGQRQALSGAEELRQQNLRFAAESIMDEKTRAATLLEIDASAWRERIALAGEGTDAQRVLQEQFDTWYRNQSIKPMLDEQREAVKKYSDIFRDGFAGMLNNGKDGWKSFTKSLITTFKTSVADQIYKMFAQPIVVNLVGNMLGLTSAAAGVAGNAATSAAGSVAGSAIGGLFGAGGLSGSLAAGAGWLTGSTTLGGALSAGTSLLGTGSLAGITSGLGVMAGALGPIALGVAGIMSVVKKLDSSGTYHTGGASSASAAGVQTVRAESLNFQPTKVSTNVNAFTAQLASSVVSILDSTATAFGKTAGYTAATAFADDTSKDGAWGGLVISKLGEKLIDWQDTRTSRWAPKEFADGEAGQKQYLAEISKSVRTALDSIGLPEWAKTMLDGLGNTPALEDLAKAVDTINATQRALGLMGERLVGFAGLSDAAVSALMKASGGIEGLAANASAYYDAFYSEGEKAKVVTDQVTAALKAVGLTIPETREGYRALTEAQLALGAAGAPAAAALLANAQAFASVVPAAQAATDATNDAVKTQQEILSERLDLQNQLDELTMTQAQAAAKARGAVDSHNLALYDQVVAAKAAKEAADQAKVAAEALANTNAGYQQQIDRLIAARQGDAAVRALEIAGMDSSTIALYDRLAGLKAEESAAQAAKAAAEALASTNAGYQQQIATILAARQGEAAVRALETAGMDSSTVALYDRLAALKAEETAAQAAKAAAEALANTNAGYEQQIAQLLAARQGEAAIRALEIAGMDATTVALYDRLAALKAEDAAAAASAQRNAELMEAWARNYEQQQQQAAERAAQLASQRADKELTLYNLTHTAAEQLAHKRELELAAMDATLRPLQEQIYAQEDMASAAQLAADAIKAAADKAAAVASERAGIDRDILTLKGDTAALRALELAALDPANRAAKQAYYDLQDKIAADQKAAQAAEQFAQAQAQAAEAQQRAADEAAQAAEQLKQAWQSATDSIMDEVAKIRGISSAASSETLAGAEASFSIALAQARAGDQEAYKALPQLAENVLQLLDKVAGSEFELTAGRARIAGSLETLSASTAARMGLKLPSFDVGADSLPRDMIAQVHEGEGILTKSQNVAFSKFINDPASTMTGVVDELIELRRYVRDLISSIEEYNEVNNDGNKVMAGALLRLEDRFKGWNSVGLPPTRKEVASV